jgi:lycopene cyclase domain-containing protein
MITTPIYSYPIWLVFFLILPLALVWAFKFQNLWKYKWVLGITTLGCLVVAVPWDILSVNERVWYFTVPHIFGVWLLGLPLEEYVYIFCLSLINASLTVLLWERLRVRS